MRDIGLSLKQLVGQLHKGRMEAYISLPPGADIEVFDYSFVFFPSLSFSLLPSL